MERLKRQGDFSGTKQAPFSFYYNLAEHFGLDVSSVISGEAPNLDVYTVTRSGEGFPFVRRPEFSYLHQAIRMKDRTGEPFIVTAPPPADPNAPLQCLENPRDGGVWQAAVYGVAQSRTGLKRLCKAVARGAQLERAEVK